MATVDLNSNLYNLASFSGRASHFYRSVNPLNLVKDHVRARDVVIKVKENGGIVPDGLTAEQVWDCKYIYDSAYHPSTGELVFMPGRMSFQAPGNCMIASGMLIFYKTPLQAISGQLVNQIFNSTVNYSNSPRPHFAPQDFAVAAGSACAAAYALNRFATRPGMNPLIARLVPFASVALANCINLPYMRRSELTMGMPLEDENGNVIGHSTKIGRESITKVALSRVLMATPTMVIPPLVINSLSRPGRLLATKPHLTNPLQVLLIGLALVIATPACCAIWPQRGSASVDRLEPHLRADLEKQGIQIVHFNKGL